MPLLVALGGVVIATLTTLYCLRKYNKCCWETLGMKQHIQRQIHELSKVQHGPLLRIKYKDHEKQDGQPEVVTNFTLHGLENPTMSTSTYKSHRIGESYSETNYDKYTDAVEEQ